MSNVTYISRVRIEPAGGLVRRAHLPAEEEPVVFGGHDETVEYYGVSSDEVEQHAVTLDYLAAAGG